MHQTIIDLREEHEAAEDANAGNLHMFKPCSADEAHVASKIVCWYGSFTYIYIYIGVWDCV